MYTHTYLSCTLLLPQKCRRLLRLAESLCTGPNWGYLSSQLGKGRAVSTLFTKLPHSPAWGQLRAGTQGLWTMVTILPPPSLTLSVPPPPDQHRAVLQSILPPSPPPNQRASAECPIRCPALAALPLPHLTCGPCQVHAPVAILFSSLLPALPTCADEILSSFIARLLMSRAWLRVTCSEAWQGGTGSSQPSMTPARADLERGQSP